MNDVIDSWIGGELPYGWSGTWYNTKTISSGNHIEDYREICKWIHDNIENPRSNALWMMTGNFITVHIRKPADFTWFVLRWS